MPQTRYQHLNSPISFRTRSNPSYFGGLESVPHTPCTPRTPRTPRTPATPRLKRNPSGARKAGMKPKPIPSPISAMPKTEASTQTMSAATQKDDVPAPLLTAGVKRKHSAMLRPVFETPQLNHRVSAMFREPAEQRAVLSPRLGLKRKASIKALAGIAMAVRGEGVDGMEEPEKAPKAEVEKA